jgi:DNA-binding SARP family transcriptional activator
MLRLGATGRLPSGYRAADVIGFGILGPLEARREGEEVRLGGRNQRAVLAVLLLHANRVVSIERLAEDIYGGEVPVTAVTQVHRQVSELRRALGPESASVIETRSPGYLARLEPEALDLHRFEALTGRAAEAEPEEAAELLREALALWRGPALADLSYEPFAQAAILRLEELRLAAAERRIEADLALGRHADVIPELRSMIAEAPLREHLRALLMIALYRAGRQVEALEVYRSTRDELVSGFGVEPGPELSRLEQAVLRHDEDLAAAPPPSKPARGVLLAARSAERIGALADVGAALADELTVALLVEDEARLSAATAALASLRDGRPGVRTASFVTSAEADDVLHLVSSNDAGLLLLEGRPELADGPPAELADVLERSAADVALLFAPAAGAVAGGGVLVPFGGGEHDWAAVELGAWLASATGEGLRLAGPRGSGTGGRDATRLLADASLAVQRTTRVAAEPSLVEPGPEGLLAAAAGASAVVVGLSPRWRREGLGEARRALVADPACPVLVTHRGLRPSGIAPREAATRFTWSLSG